MSIFDRVMVRDAGGLARAAVPGEGFFGNTRSVDYATDAAYTLTVNDISGGCFRITGITANRNFTTPTAAQITAAAPNMSPGDSFNFMVSVIPSFNPTWVANTGITLQGRATLPGFVISFVEVTKVSDTAYIWKCL